MPPENHEIYPLIISNDSDGLRALCKSSKLPTFKDKEKRYHWLREAIAHCPGVEMLHTLVDLGVDPHELPAVHDPGPIVLSIDKGRADCLESLLDYGVDPNQRPGDQRALLAAVSPSKSVELQLTLLQLLVEYKIDINCAFTWFGDENNLVTVLDHATDPKVKAYLRSVGAKTAAEISGKPSVARAARKDPLLNEVHQYMADKFGLPEEKSFTDMLNADSGVMVHVVKPVKRGDPLTLFTTGLSANPMQAPSELTELTGGQTEIYGEIYMQLPGNWKFTRSGAKWTWPMQHLSNLAAYPNANDAFYAFVTTIDNDDPPQPLGPKVAFDATMLIVDDNVTRSDGNTVHFYCAIPVYASEAAVGRQNINQLLDLMGTKNINRVLDLKRKPFV